MTDTPLVRFISYGSAEWLDTMADYLDIGEDVVEYYRATRAEVYRDHPRIDDHREHADMAARRLVVQAEVVYGS